MPASMSTEIGSGTGSSQRDGVSDSSLPAGAWGRRGVCHSSGVCTVSLRRFESTSALPGQLLVPSAAAQLLPAHCERRTVDLLELFQLCPSAVLHPAPHTPLLFLASSLPAT